MDTSRTSASDIPKGGWVDRLLPAAAAPYARLARLDRPIGTWLLLFPCWWGTALAWAAHPDAGTMEALRLALLFGIGALAMRGTGCVWNDIVDRDFDGRVARTADRPIPSGAVSVRQAILFAACLTAVGAAVLFSLPPAAIVVGLCSLPLVACYPFAKRFIYWPQAVLGLTFNWGALVGWTAVTGELGWPALALYAAGFAWTLGYDTIYAHQDKEDDVLIGVKSTALLLGHGTRPWLYGFYAAMLALMGLVGWAAGIAWPFYLGLAAAAAHLGWQAADVRMDDPADCLAKFRGNRFVGWAILAGAIAAGAVDRLT